MHWTKLPKGSWLCQSQLDNAGGFQPLLYFLPFTNASSTRYCTILLTLLFRTLSVSNTNEITSSILHSMLLPSYRWLYTTTGGDVAACYLVLFITEKPKDQGISEIRLWDFISTAFNVYAYNQALLKNILQ